MSERYIARHGLWTQKQQAVAKQVLDRIDT